MVGQKCSFEDVQIDKQRYHLFRIDTINYWLFFFLAFQHFPGYLMLNHFYKEQVNICPVYTRVKGKHRLNTGLLCIRIKKVNISTVTNVQKCGQRVPWAWASITEGHRIKEWDKNLVNSFSIYLNSTNRATSYIC